FDQVAVGITLTFATVAATTLTTGAATRTLAILTVLLLFELLFSIQHFFVDLLDRSAAWLALFARLALFTGGALATRLLSIASFTWLTLFARFAGRTLFTCGALVTRLTFLAGLAFFTSRTLVTLATRLLSVTCFAGLAFFTRLAGWTLLTGLALFVAAVVGIATITATVLLATGTALIIAALRTCVGGFFNRLGRFFLAGEQADQRFHQALEQARCRSGNRRQWRSRGWVNMFRCGAITVDGFHRSFLAHQ